MVLPLVVPTPAVAADLPVLDAHEQVATAREAEGRRHTVRTGETVYDIAERYDVSPGAIARRNHLDATSMIRPGQRLVIPSASSGSTETSSSAGPGRSGPTRGYTVRTGDTLDGIARRHDMSVTRLARLNGIGSSELIQPGQRLRVTGTAARPAKRSTQADQRTSASRHTVRTG